MELGGLFSESGVLHLNIMFKIIVIGDSGAGKTSLVNNFVGRPFDPLHRATIACDFSLKILSIEGQSLRIQMWDIAGELSVKQRAGPAPGHHQALLPWGCGRPRRRRHPAPRNPRPVSTHTHPRNHRSHAYSARAWKQRVDELLHPGIPMMLVVNKYDVVEEGG